MGAAAASPKVIPCFIYQVWIVAHDDAPFSVRQSNAGYESMALFMKEQVAARKVEIQHSNSKDAFSLLVKANEQEETKYKLSDEELVGVFLVLSQVLLSMTLTRC